MNSPHAVPAEQVVEANKRWCNLISESNWPELEAVLDPDFTYRHSTGTLDRKAAWIARMQSRPRSIEARNASVRLFGSVAVLSSDQAVTFSQSDAMPKIVQLNVLQVWHRLDRWILAAHYSAVSPAGN
ncbi:MAG TPA: nuclear transport factor 2 family protein [Jatrophihabitantaceae bacterium]|nr:nuclear transport factor 2 family protein [Jatrophihabitantaceae bacterium]